MGRNMGLLYSAALVFAAGAVYTLYRKLRPLPDDVDFYLDPDELTLEKQRDGAMGERMAAVRRLTPAGPPAESVRILSREARHG